jgi:hypothetical protein
MEVKRLHDEVATLTAAIEAAIEEAINKRPKSMDDLNDVPGASEISNKDFALTHMNTGSEVVGWVDDF